MKCIRISYVVHTKFLWNCDSGISREIRMKWASRSIVGYQCQGPPTNVMCDVRDVLWVHLNICLSRIIPNLRRYLLHCLLSVILKLLYKTWNIYQHFIRGCWRSFPLKLEISAPHIVDTMYTDKIVTLFNIHIYNKHSQKTRDRWAVL